MGVDLEMDPDSGTRDRIHETNNGDPQHGSMPERLAADSVSSSAGTV